MLLALLGYLNQEWAEHAGLNEATQKWENSVMYALSVARVLNQEWAEHAGLNDAPQKWENSVMYALSVARVLKSREGWTRSSK